MDERMLAEVLAAHADQLVRGEAREAEYLALFPDYRKELALLLELARRVKDTLALVQPSEAFRRRLHQELSTTGRRRLTASLPSERPRWRQPWVIGAAALGSAISLASAVGVVAYLRRSKAAGPATAV
ncbi:MAG: hypothetical protein H8D78_15635 [Chloroflexi bacterium]|nr:hypothetical protein [Chloroflexota bacterium]